MKRKNRASKARVSKIASKSTSALARLHSETLTAMSFNGVESLSGLGNWEDPQMFEWTEKGFCVKCNEAGEVLICGNGDCPLSVHECCLGNAPCFDDEGKYYCPFCSHKRAVSELDEMEKELASAKEKARVARKLLCVFLNGGYEKQTIQMKEFCKLMEVGGKEPYRAVIDQQEEAVDARGRINEILRADTSLLSKGAGAMWTSGEQAEEISKPKQKSEEDQQAAASAAKILSNSHANERCGVVSGADNHSKHGDSSSNRSIVDQQNITATTDVLIQNCGTEGTPECSKPIDPQDKSSSEQVSDSIESAEDENLENAINSKHVKPNKPPMCSANPAIPSLKRKKLVWTGEEEEMLKRM
ncbi:hypothetical protein Syun_026093 [Stephania yunnanensis]|uniref:Zinc finger PHD-type domain-containing protein n=1 Tax=Stephania yunnanensis TaxID=152371 RepID=A0AAP0EYD0_9MAGN